MNNTANTYFCEQCRESVKRGAKICPHCSSEQHPASCKTCRKKIKKGSKLVAAFVAFVAFVAFLLAPFRVCVGEQHPAPCKTCRKKIKVGFKVFVAYAALPIAAFLLWVGISDSMEKVNWLTLARHFFFALVCLHFFTFHIVYDDDEKKGGGDDGGGGGGGGE